MEESLDILKVDVSLKQRAETQGKS